MDDAWSLVENAFDPATARAWEGISTLGSGALHVRGSLEEHLAGAPQNVEYDRPPANTTAERFRETKAAWGTYVPGVFGPHPLLRREMINLPWPLGLAPEVDGERLDAESSRLAQWRRRLDLRRAVVSRTLVWHTRSGAAVDVRFERFVSAARPRLVLQRLILQADRPTEVTLRAGLDADVRTNGFDHFEAVTLEPAGDDALLCRVRTNGGGDVAMLSRLAAPGAPWTFHPRHRAADLVATLSLKAGKPITIEKRTAVATSRDLNPADPADLLAAAAPLAWDDLLAEHAAEWERRWAASDVRIDGDPDSQRAMRAALYHLHRALVRGDGRVAIGAKGHAGEAYRGHYFWDTEMYLLPFYLYTDPHAARPLLDFRLHTLPAARRLAASSGYRGARYPWQSDAQGNECCANWQYADHEIHVTAAVAYALVHYARAADRLDLLRGPFAPVLVETARYWLDRLDQRPGDDGPCLLGVMGPDEYAPLSANNAYTNRLVTLALAMAAEFGSAAGASDAECAAFADAAARLPIPRHPDDPDLVLQSEDFPALAEPDFDRFWTDRSQPFARFVSQERLYRTKCLKQADVLMLMMLFPHEFSDREVRRAWDYYLPLTTHDSSLSPAAHAIVAARLALDDEAWAFWQRTAGKDLDVAHGGAAEGVHIAADAGTWQVAVFGFAGLATAMQADRLTLRPRLPRAWSRLAFPVVWKGRPVAVDITPDSTTVTNRSKENLDVSVAGRDETVPPGQSAVFRTPRA